MSAALLLLLLVVFQHFSLVTVAGYPITLGALAGLVLLWRTSAKLPWGTLIAFVTPLVALSGLAALLDASNASSTQFPRTLLLFLMAAFIMICGARMRLFEGLVGKLVLRYVLVSLALVSTLCLLQALLGSRGDTTFFNPWRSRQYLYQYDPLLQFNPIPRAQGFYLEPSYAAFIIGSLWMVLMSLRYRATLATVLALVGLVATQSATGLLLFLVLLFIIALRSSSKLRLSALLLVTLLMTISGPYLLTRLSSSGQGGSSANYRLIAPLRIVGETLAGTPLGHPLGSLSAVVAQYGLENGSVRGTSLDNGFYVLIFYFGWVGLGVCLALFVWGVRQVLRRGTPLGYILIPVWIVGSLFFSGGIMLPEYALMIGLLLACRRSIPLPSEPPDERTNCVIAPAVYSFGDLQRRRRVAAHLEVLGRSSSRGGLRS